MPSPDTFSIPVIGDMVKRYLLRSRVSVDPFARNSNLATHTNDLNHCTTAQHHLEAAVFLELLAKRRVVCDLALFDPPYSPRQMSECYQAIGQKASMKDTQNATLCSRVRDKFMPILVPGAVVLSFGWNSSGMGIKRGFELIEVQLVAHGGAHNDTICIAERKVTA